ncbi:MAG TPA: 30S ribosomal protein S20 [Pirellulales bacterium]|jgi:small subunit ribosomal protein S20|nr:30S ribosomal protein S20 [Pirellulales bacterium]
MPNTKSAKKRLKQSLARRTRNRSTRAALKTQTRKVREAVASGNLELAATEFKLATKKIDQAAAKNVVHDNAAARLKSRLSAAIKAGKQKSKAAPA